MLARLGLVARIFNMANLGDKRTMTPLGQAKNLIKKVNKVYKAEMNY